QLPVRQPGTLEEHRRVAWPFGGAGLHDVHQGRLRVRRQGRRHPVVIVPEPGPVHNGVCRPGAGNASRALVGNDLQVREIPAGAVPHPQTHQPLRAAAQLGDHQTRLFRVGDEDTHLGTRDHHAHMEPRVGVGRGTHGLLEDSRPFGAKLLPRIGWLRYVLYRVAVPRRVIRPEVERAEVNRVIRRAIEPMKGDADKALPLHVLAPDVKLDGPVAELDPFEIGHALAGPLVEMHTLPSPVAQSTHSAVEHVQVFGLDASLTGEVGSDKEEEKGRLVHSYLSDSTGSTAAARRAGRMPARSPTPIRMATQIRAMGQDSLGFRMYCIASLPSVGIASTPSTMSVATASPTSPPDRAIAMASNRNCAMMC